ncbi:MAG: hypothetical protein E2604_03985 [Flavobacterium sp.]|nr:hypothetical protein [Flavobacterium sp.]
MIKMTDFSNIKKIRALGFIQEVLLDGGEYFLKEELFDYFAKPLLLIFLFGFFPTLISGILLGIRLRKNL